MFVCLLKLLTLKIRYQISNYFTIFCDHKSYIKKYINNNVLKLLFMMNYLILVYILILYMHNNININKCTNVIT